jgi:hypothetical protein
MEYTGPMSERQLSDIEAFDRFCKSHGLPRPHGYGSSAEGNGSFLHEDPESFIVVKAPKMQFDSQSYNDEAQPQAHLPRMVRVANWMKSLVQ